MDISVRDINLHPSDHRISSLEKTDWDVVVIGSGPAGRTLADKTAAEGFSSLVIEDELFGGDCPFFACIPSKALLRPAEVLEAARSVGGSRELVSQSHSVDVEATFARRDQIVRNWDDEFLVKLSTDSNVIVVRGLGRLSGVREVTVEAQDKTNVQIKAKYAVVLSTGSAIKMPDIPGLLTSQPWTSRDAVSSNQVPEHLVILGAGVVGCEMATAYGRFGGKVTLIASSKELLPRYEPEAGKRVRNSLEGMGVDVKLSTKISEIVTKPEGGTSIILSNGGLLSNVKILIATGREPRLRDVGLDSLGISASVDALKIDDTLCVNAVDGKWLYAIGDCNGRAPLTHMGMYQSHCAAEAIIARQKGIIFDDSSPIPWSRYTATADHHCTPQVIVTDPIVATAGLTLSEARKKGLNAKEVAVPFQFPGAWLHGDDYDGWAQWVVDIEARKLVGATFVGRDASDLLHASTVAIVGEVTLDRLRHAIASFPTMSQIYLQLFNACGL